MPLPAHLAAKGRARLPRRIGPWVERRDHRDIEAALAQRLGDDIAIAAVVARPAQHRHWPPGGDAPDPFRRALPRGLHQAANGLAAIDQRLLGGLHLRDGEDLLGGRHSGTLAVRNVKSSP